MTLLLKTQDAIQSNESTKEFNLSFRNYRPKCKKLEKYLKQNKSIVQNIEKSLDHEMLDAINSFIKKDPLTQLEIKHSNLDLKRDLSKKLNSVVPQTNAALLCLIKKDAEINKYNQSAQAKLLELSIEDKVQASRSSDDDAC
ncbi:uncharacterized protein LOC128884282 [Hylaeus volcanicus]|uniref:uncharacterized protein LOC128884282 n=1 Tax=Hylaeus volcanicus TaxID=313075 RepID=UPI0023B79CC5|nr:uncharacterized protein LOC128884282 [Hylaeus volcanicus]